MNLLSRRRKVLAIAAVVDVALHSRSTSVRAKALAARHKLPPRHLETSLQGLVRAKILKGVRGPRGGYELARVRLGLKMGIPLYRFPLCALFLIIGLVGLIWPASARAQHDSSLELTPNALAFGELDLASQASATRQFEIKNPGSAPLKLSIRGSTGSDAFHVSSGTLSETIPPGGSVAVSVTFQPLGVGNFQGKVHMTSNATKGKGSGDVNLSGSAKGNINDKLKNAIHAGAGTTVDIAPLAKKGTSAAGTFKPADTGKIFDAIFERIGIKTCDTDPASLSLSEGYIEFIPDSQVLNKQGTRTTFGYFIRVSQGEQATEYFALFSYDKIIVKKKATAVTICATEFFLFGPFGRQDATIAPDPVALTEGLAIDKDGNLLSEVPLDLARVKNFIKDSPETEPVKPKVEIPKKGCLLCHGRDDQFPETTIPFPWVKSP